MSSDLASSTSPYLQAHADNPIDWRQWGAAAFAEARERDVPVMVSIGYSTCHWCHVMAAESFSDPAMGELLRESVVAIKVDREELPAVDAFYMDALLSMRGQGGWPLTVFTAPDSRPFFAGTYYPDQPRGGMPSLSQVVTTIAHTWKTDRRRAETIATQLSESLVRLPDLAMGLDADAPIPQIDDDVLTAAAKSLLSAEDTRWGGFGDAPKFPPTMSLMHLLRRHQRVGGDEWLVPVRRAFTGMASGGMRDHVDGGIARYSVDAQWHVPHFEKMLYDNALYLRAAVRWHQTEHALDPASRHTRLAEREALDTARFLLERLELPGGGFAAGLDADSVDDAGDRTEGAYYLETHDSVPPPFAPLGPVEAAASSRSWAVGLPDLTAWIGGGAGSVPWESDTAAEALAELAQRRTARPYPDRDNKLITEWNGLAITALQEAGEWFTVEAWTDAARRAFDAVVRDNFLHQPARSSTAGTKGPGAASLADLAQLAIAAHAVGDRGAFTRVLNAALGFVVFPRKQSQEQEEGNLPHRWVDASLLDAHSDGIVPVRGSDPLDNALPSGRSALIEALGLVEAGDTMEVDSRVEVASTADLAELRSRLFASVLPAFQEATRAMGWVLAEAEEPPTSHSGGTSI